MINCILDFWRRLNDWIEGIEPERHGYKEHEENEVRSTAELGKEYLKHFVPSTKRIRYHNKTFTERYIEWKNAAGILFFSRLYNVMAIVICIAIIAILLLTVSFLPSFGSPDNPVNNEVFAKYITDSLKDTNATNVVAGVILDYRAFDTFGESTVLFIAACAVTILLRDDRKNRSKSNLDDEMNEPRQDTILTAVSMLVIPTLILYGIYVILNGHISPGGGFSGGTLIGSGLILYLSTFGVRRTSYFISTRVYTGVIFCALSFYALAKGYSFFTGANNLKMRIPHGVPGDILSGGLILPLNIAVGLVVACTIYGFYALFSKGEI